MQQKVKTFPGQSQGACGSLILSMGSSLCHPMVTRMGSPLRALLCPKPSEPETSGVPHLHPPARGAPSAPVTLPSGSSLPNRSLAQQRS